MTRLQTEIPTERTYYLKEHNRVYSIGYENTNHYDVSPMNSVQTDLENQFEPYIRQFTQHWNAFLENEETLVAEVYAVSEDGMIGVVFVPEKRDCYPDVMKVFNEGLEAIRERFPDAKWSDVIPRRSFFETLDEAIIVIKPNAKTFWTEQEGVMDANDTIKNRFVETLLEDKPEEWRHLWQT